MSYSTKSVSYLVGFAVSRLGISKTAAKKMGKERIITALQQLDLAAAQAEQPTLMLSMAAAKVLGREEVLGEVSGHGGQSFTVRRDVNAVVWCNCPLWAQSRRQPRTCEHMSALVDDGLLSGEYVMSEAEVLEARSEVVEVPAAKQVVAQPRMRAPRASVKPVNLKSIFSALRQSKIAAAGGVAGTVEENLAWAEKKGYRGLAITLRGPGAANVIHYRGVGDTTHAAIRNELLSLLTHEVGHNMFVLAGEGELTITVAPPGAELVDSGVTLVERAADLDE